MGIEEEDLPVAERISSLVQLNNLNPKSSAKKPRRSF